jgi:hypothetical protein
MPLLWIDRDPAWAVLPLGELCVALTADRERPACLDPADGGIGALVVRMEQGGDVWTLIAHHAGPPVRVNGSPLLLGVRVLRDKDEIRIQGSRFFFSTESQPHIEPFPGSAKTTFCPRCKEAIEKDSPAVRCPGCGVWHHQSEDLPCWTYDARCALCDQPSALDAGYRWTPEEL